MDARSSSVRTPSESSSANDRSIPEMPASSSKLLNLRVKDYQHQTASSSKADSVQQKTDLELLQRLLLPERQADDKLTYQRTEDQSRKSVNEVTGCPGSDCSTDPGFRYKELVPGRPGLQPAAPPASSPAISAPISSSSSSERANPGLPESSIAFWNAMKVYCSKIDGSRPRVATAAENRLASEKQFKPTASSLYTEADYQLPPRPRETENPMMKPNIYSGHPYSDARTLYSERIQHRPVELDTGYGRIPPGPISYDHRDSVPGVLHRPRLPAPPPRREARYGNADSMPNRSFDVDSRFQGYATDDTKPCFPSVVSKADSKVQSSDSTSTAIPPTRVQYSAPSAAEKLVPNDETPAAVPAVQTDDNKPPDPPASGTNVPTASGDGPSASLTTGEGPEPTNTRPKLMGILKNRIEVKTSSTIEWKTLQPKQ